VRDTSGGYGAVLGERPIRDLLLASLCGRFAFNALGLGFVLFAAEETDSVAVMGGLIAAFAVTTAFAPARGRIVDRHGPGALAALAGLCSLCVGLLVAVGTAGAAPWTFVVLAGLAGLFAPPLGPFARSVWSGLPEGSELQTRVHALDAAGEEAALIGSPLIVSLFVLVGSPGLALGVCAAALFAGAAAAGRTSLARAPTVPAGTPPPIPASLWLVFVAFLPTAAALGALDIAIPAAATAQGRPAAAGAIEAAMAVGTVAGSLLAGRWVLGSPQRRVLAMQALMAAGLAVSTLFATQLGLLGAVLVVPGIALGVLFASLYLLVGRLAPPGSGTRTFGWLVTVNNGGLALGAAAGGVLADASGPAAGLWLAAGCALAGIAPALGALALSAREPRAHPSARTR
jgi:MFS family permease